MQSDKSSARQQPANNDKAAKHHLLKRIFGLSSTATTLVVLVDVVLSAPDSFIGGGTLISCTVATLLALVVFILQKFAGDNFKTSCKKAIISGVLTAIPFPLTALLSVFGLFGGRQEQQQQDPTMRNVTPEKK